MKTIGIIGGMSWESTIEYYKLINLLVNKKLGNLHSAKMLIESYDFDEIEKFQSTEKWEDLTKILINSAKNLEKSGADYVAIATNTMHICAPEVQEALNVPFLHIADATAKLILKKNIKTVALFGTKYTMSKDFYKGKLEKEYNINVILPEAEEQQYINRVIYEELCKGMTKEDSKLKLQDIIKNCSDKGAQAVVLGCTELPNIISDACIPVINTLEAHCNEIVDKITNI